MYEDTSSVKVHRSGLGEYMAFDLTPRPELVYHPAPWLLWIRAKVAGAILAGDEARRSLRKLQVDHALLVCRGLDSIALPIFTEVYRTPICFEVLLVRREGEVRNVVRGPHVWFAGVAGVDLGAELCRCPDAPAQWRVRTSAASPSRLLSYITLLYISDISPMWPSSLVM